MDAIPYSGKYDGVVGVLGAIEAINVLRRFATGSFFKFSSLTHAFWYTSNN